MFKQAIIAAVAAGALLSTVAGASAQSSMASPNSMSGSAMSAAMDHGMPEGMGGGDGATYTGSPDLQAAISLVVAGGAPGRFSIAKALTALAGAKTANAEIAKLTKQYGAASFGSFVAVQNFAVDDAVAKATAAGVTFPKPALQGAALAKRVVMLGVQNGTYYEGVQLDHLVSNKIHEAVMDDIDRKFGAAADANYHKVADQAHYDLAQALGATSVKLAPFH